TPRWGSPVAVSASVTDSAVVLKGSIAVVDPADSEHVDMWSALTLYRDATGALGGPITAVGQTSFAGGDAGVTYTIASGGKSALDRTAPALRSVPVSPLGPQNALLPWDAVPVEVAEGVDASALVGAASLYRLDGSSNWLPGPVSFAPEPVSAGATWGGVVRA